MNRSGLLVAALFLAALLSACAALIPDQDVVDLFGFDNVIVDMSVSQVAPTGSGIAPQAGEIVAAGSVSHAVDASDFDLPFDPTSASESMGAQWIRLFRPTPTDDLPETLSLDSVSFEVNFTDDVTTFTKLVTASFSPPAMFDRDDTKCNINRCDYLPVGSTEASITVDISGSDIVEVLAILGTTNEPKVASGEAMLFFSDDPLLAGVSQAQMKVEAFGGVISFR